MNKKGFTLIEILMVLVILVAITVAGTFGIQSIQKKSEEQALNELYSEILLAADVYLNENETFATDLLNKEVDEKCIRISGTKCKDVSGQNCSEGYGMFLYI